MSAASINTAVEMVVESVEDLANAIYDGRDTDRRDKRATDAAAGEILERRGALRAALRDFLGPRIRLIEGGKGVQPYVAGTPDDEKPRCTQCLRNEPCPLGHGNQCRYWTAAIRRMHQAASAPLPEDGDRA